MNQTPRGVDDILAELDERRTIDPDVHGAHLFGLVYPTGHEEIEDLVRSVYDRFLFSNALNPLRFREQATIERELLTSISTLLNREVRAVPPGSMTSGGTESILMSLPPLVAWRYDWKPEPGSPEAQLYTDFLPPKNWTEGNT